MNSYQRIFGTGPRGLLASGILVYLTRMVVDSAGPMPIHGLPAVGQGVFYTGTALGGLLIAWSLKSLPASERGRHLVSNGAFHWFRHPLYAAFLLFICPAWAIFQDHWLYLAWAGLLHPLWHWNIRGEEKLMRDAFGEDYDRYCAVTGRFVPRIF